MTASGSRSGVHRVAGVPVARRVCGGGPDAPGRRRRMTQSGVNLGAALSGIPLVGRGTPRRRKNAFAGAGGPLTELRIGPGGVHPPDRDPDLPAPRARAAGPLALPLSALAVGAPATPARRPPCHPHRAPRSRRPRSTRFSRFARSPAWSTATCFGSRQTPSATGWLSPRPSGARRARHGRAPSEPRLTNEASAGAELPCKPIRGLLDFLCSREPSNI